MIHGIGTDIVHIPRVQRLLARFGDRFPRRILARDERVDYVAARCPHRFLAKRFAVKEAAAKALGTGFRQGIVMCDIGLQHDALGRPILCFYGKAKQTMASMGVACGHVSVSDERAYAIAFVTLMRL